MKKLIFSVLLLLMTVIGAVAQQSLPYNYGFENNNLSADGWTLNNCYSSTGISSSASKTGSYGFCFYYRSNPPQYLISPELTGTVNGVQVEFFYKNYSSSYAETFQVGYSTTDNSTSSFTWGAEITASDEQWTLFSENFPLGTKYVSVKLNSDDQFYLFLDDFSFTAPASCPKPTNITATSITSVSADIAWTAGGSESNWVLKYGPVGFNVETEGTSQNISTTPAFQITGLTANTQYDVYVKAMCGGSDESDWKNASFKTACSEESVPYTETFESFDANIVPNCWDNSASTTSSASGSSSYYVWGVYSYNSNKMLRMYNYYVNNGTALINSPSISIPSDGVYQLVFEYSHTASCGAFDVKISEDGGSSFAVLGSFAKVGTSTSYTNPGSFTEVDPISLAAYAGKTVILQFFATADYSSGAIFVDNISIDLQPSCIKPTALSKSNVTARTVDLSWTAGGTETAWQICLNDNEGTIIDVNTNSYTLTGLTPETAYNVKVRAKCSESDFSEWTSNVSFTTLISCYAPTALSATLTPGDGSVATLTWTENGTATAWTIEYSTASDFAGATSVDVNGTPVADLTGLTAETTYYARVRTVCGVDDESSWSSVINFTPTNAYSITFNDGTTTNDYVPVYGNWVDNYSRSQFIIPASELTSLQWGTITKLTFYSSNASINWGAAQFDVRLKEVGYTTISSLEDWDGMSLAYHGSLAISGNVMEVTFSTPYTYQGGNLMIGTNETNSGTYSNCSWYGVSATGASLGGYGTSISQRNFLPKVTIEYTPGVAPSCIPTTNVLASNVAARTVVLSWTAGGTETAWQICLNDDEDNLVEANTNPYTLTGLTPETTYNVKVRAKCSESDFSEWTNSISFTTAVACPVPTALTYSGVSNTSATISWTAGASESLWNLKYKVSTAEEWTEVNGLTSPTYTITELTPATSYSVQVQADCEEESVSAWLSGNFTTECDAITVDAENPYTEDFTGLTSSSFPPQCWSQERTANGSGSGTDYPNGAWTINTGTQGTGSNPPMAQLRDTKAGSRHNLVTAPLSMASGNYVVSVRVYRNAYGTSHTVEGINLYLSKTSDLVSVGNDAVDLGFISRNYTVASDVNSDIIGAETAQGWYTYKVPFTISTDGVYYVIFEGRNNYGSSTYMDDVVVRPISTGAEILTYSLPTEAAPAIITSGDNTGTIDITVTYSTNFDVDLNPTYTISDYAQISAPVITGDGDSRTIAYTVTAEAGNHKDWTVNVTKVPLSRDAFITGFTFVGQKAGSPAEIVSNTESNTYTVNAVAEWNVDLTSIAPEITISPAAEITPESGYARDFSSPVPYTVTAEDGTTFHIYSVTIINDPDACVNPLAVNANDVTATTATLSWAQAYTETSYIVKVSTEAMTNMAATADVFDGTVYATTKALENLTANTQYFVYVQSNCDNAEGWTEYSFRTECGAFAVPFVETFENNSETVNCWTAISNNTANDVASGKMGIFDVSGNNVFRFSSYSNASDYNQYLITPELALTEDAVLTFDYAKSSSYDDESFRVMTSTTDANIASFIALGTEVTATSTDFAEYRIVVPAATKYIAINYFSNFKYYLYVDNFKLTNVYTIAASAGANGSISQDGNVEVEYGESQSFTITPDDCYHIASVMVDDNVDVTDAVIAANGVYTFENVNANHTIAATFAMDTYTITATAGENGTITETSTVNCGANKEITITPASNCYRIASVIVDDVNVTATVVAANGVYTFENVIADHTIAATFEQITYAITTTADANGTITETCTVNCGADKEITITPANCYRIASVLVDDVEAINDVVDGVYTFENVIANHTIAATFAISTYNITATAGEGGSITANDGNGNVANCGENKAFTITANEGYRIASVIVDETENVTEAVIAAEGVYTFENVTADHTIAATFERVHTISAGTGADGSITPEGIISVLDGESQTFTITPVNECFRIGQVMVDGVDVTDEVIANNGVYTFENVTENHNIVANFDAITLTITATASEGGTITHNADYEVIPCASNESYTIVANDGYRIVSVIVDDEIDVTNEVIANNGVYTFTNVRANHTIAATFELIPANTYTITATAGEGGTITPNGEVTVYEGDNQDFTIVAAAGYRIASVMVDSETEVVAQLVDGVYTFENVTANHTINATFEAIPTYTITATAGENGTITPNGEVVVAEGAEQAFAIVANEGYKIASVMVDETENVTEQLVEGVYTFTNVAANHTIAATFEAIPVPTYTITATANEGGSINPAGEVTVTEGESKPFTILANEGYRIVSVMVDETENVTEQLVDGVYTFVNVTANHTIAATFEAIPTYTITATANEGGSITPAEMTVVEGGNAEFTIVANDGFRIVSVMVDETENVTAQLVDGVYTFVNVTANHTIAATFEAIPTYTITATANEGGSITPAEMTVVEGGNASFTIEVATGYHIVSVIVDAATENEVDVTSELVNGVYTFANVTANHTINATFAINTYVITATAGENGTITPNGEVNVNYGATQTFSISANGGYRIMSVLVDGAEAISELVEGVYTFTNVTANHTIAATFVSETATTHTITATAGENGTITPAGAIEVVEGENKSFTIEAATGYHIVSVMVDETENVTEQLVNGVYTFENVTADHTIAAAFAINNYIITATAGDNGTITPAQVSVNHGASQEFTITANEGYRIASVMVDETENVTEQLVDGVYTFVNVTANHTIAATFEAIPTYTITATAGEGGAINPAEVTVVEGGNASFTITANEGYRIASVIVDATTENEANVTEQLVEGVYTFANVTANHTIAAIFEAIPGPVTYTITATAGEGGSINPAEVTVVEGGNAEFTITANEGYRIASVIVDATTENEANVTDALENGVYTFTNVTANHTIAATFEAIPGPVTYTITVNAGENGTVTYNDEEVTAPVVVNEGATPAFVITPAENYQIGVLTVDEEEVTLTTEELAGYTYTFAAVEGNHTLAVTFVPVSSAEMFEVGSMTVYPNPNNGMFSIDFSNIEGDATYQLINASGAVVETRDINVMNGETMNFNHDLRPGAYFVRIINGDKVYVEQIVVE